MRVRVLFEFRNGDGNFLRLDKSGKFVACAGENDIGAMESAYLLALTEHGARLEALQKIFQDRRAAGHD